MGSAPTGEVKTDAVTVVVASLSTLSVYLVPLIALLLSFDAIAGEIDRGTLQLVLASPVSRGAVLMGKFLGHVAVLGIAVSFGYGIAGLVAFFANGGGEAGALIGVGRLIASSIVLGATFVAIGYIASASVRQTGTAAALAVAIWLFAVVLYDLALLGGLLASQDGVFARDVFPWLLVFNPADAFRLYNMSAIDAAAVGSNLGGGVGSALPLVRTCDHAQPGRLGCHRAGAFNFHSQKGPAMNDAHKAGSHCRRGDQRFGLQRTTIKNRSAAAGGPDRRIRRALLQHDHSGAHRAEGADLSRQQSASDLVQSGA